MNQQDLGAEIESLLNRTKKSIIQEKTKVQHRVQHRVQYRVQYRVQQFTLIVFAIFVIALIGFAAGNQNRYPDGSEPTSSIEVVYASSEVVQPPAIETTTSTSQIEPEPSYEAKEYTRESYGVASTYGWGEKLNPHTSCGQDFDANVIAVALPEILNDRSLCGTMVEITYKDKTILAEAWDGGPHPRLNRMVDLTKAAALELGITNPTIFSVTMKY